MAQCLQPSLEMLIDGVGMVAAEYQRQPADAFILVKPVQRDIVREPAFTQPGQQAAGRFIQ